MKIEINQDQFLEAMVQELKEQREMAQKLLTVSQEASHVYLGTFHANREKDIKAMKKLVKAFDRVIDWNTP